MVLSTRSSHWVATQSATCRFTCVWVALASKAVSQTFLCMSSSVSATTGSWASALPVDSTVTQSRMDFTGSVSNLKVTWLRASAAALSCPFWYLMLKVNPASEFTKGCQVASKLGLGNEWLPEQVFLKLTPKWPTSELGTPVLWNGSYIHKQSRNGLHRLPDGINH